MNTLEKKQVYPNLTHAVYPIGTVLTRLGSLTLFDFWARKIFNLFLSITSISQYRIFYSLF